MYSSHRGAPGGAKRASGCITSLHIAGEIILADSTRTTKLPNLIPYQLFWLYGIAVGHCTAAFDLWYNFIISTQLDTLGHFPAI